MDARIAVICSVLLLSSLAQPMMVEDSEETTKEIESDLPPTSLPTAEEGNVPAPSISKNCTTARNLAGSCVARVHCEYSTNAIDRTLYATRGYVKPCNSDEVCCPLDFVVPGGGTPDNLKPHSENDSAFEFDDDD